MIVLIRKAVLVIGLLIALLGITLDYVLPGASPGLNLPQLLIIAAGFSLALGAWLLGRAGTRRRYTLKRRKTLFSVLVIILITLLALEFLLASFGIATYFFSAPPEIIVTPVDWWVCDAPGCHHIYDRTAAACQEGSLAGRHCDINSQGFADSQEFVADAIPEGGFRVLALGDSFTFGMTADKGQSFIELLEARFPEALVWNTGMAGTGTAQAIASFKHFAPILQPQLTILGFHMNDFKDNILPIEKSFRAQDALNRLAGVHFHFYDNWGNVFDTDRQTALEYYGHAVGPPRNRIEYAIGITRLGTLALRLRDALGTLSGSLLARQISATRLQLAELRDLARAQGSDLLALIVPYRDDMLSPSDEYRASLQLMQDVGIAYLDPIHVLVERTDYMEPPDDHWNNFGHQKVATFLNECIGKYMVAGNLAACDSAVIP